MEAEFTIPVPDSDLRDMTELNRLENGHLFHEAPQESVEGAEIRFHSPKPCSREKSEGLPAMPVAVPVFRNKDFPRTASGAADVLPKDDPSEPLPDLSFRRYLI